MVFRTVTWIKKLFQNQLRGHTRSAADSIDFSLNSLISLWFPESKNKDV